MTLVVGLLSQSEKPTSLLEAIQGFRSGFRVESCYEVSPESFRIIPGAPFSYWVTDQLRGVFDRVKPFESPGRIAKLGASTKNDFRFLRVWWELIKSSESFDEWRPFAKGGAYSPFFADVYLSIRWGENAKEMEADLLRKFPYLGDNADFVLHRSNPYGRPGITWAQRTQKGLSMRALPAGCVFAAKGPAAFVEGTNDELLAVLALTNSESFRFLVSLQIAFGSYNVQVIQNTPLPDVPLSLLHKLSSLALRGWEHKRTLDTVNENSHAFMLPASLRSRLGSYDIAAIEVELASIQAEIDEIAFELYGFSQEDRVAALGAAGVEADVDEPSEDEGDEDDAFEDTPSGDGLLSWAVGVAFGRFDWRLATGERLVPPEPEPFDPLPAKSPGMLLDDAKPFHKHAGILVDDLGHHHDLSRLVEQVLETVDASVAEDVRRWVQKDFFAFHLKRYSKSRRKAPIYWPLATASGSYTLWLYYPSLSDQTLFTAVNDFVDPKLEDVRKELQVLRDKGAGRNKQDEKSLETLVSLEHELADLRDSLLEIAPSYRPNHDDGVQITAAPLWKLFRHKPWQKVLKDTWAKLEKGDYDWAHLAMNYWSQRVRDKCTTDKSLAIAHNLEHLYIEPEIAPKKARGRAKKQDV